MSMQNIPASGYVVPVDNLKRLLSQDVLSELESLMEDPATGEEICELLNSCIPGIPPISEVYFHGEDDSSEDLEHGKFYAIFDESDLYSKVPTAALFSLFERDIIPKSSHWTVWG